MHVSQTTSIPNRHSPECQFPKLLRSSITTCFPLPKSVSRISRDEGIQNCCIQEIDVVGKHIFLICAFGKKTWCRNFMIWLGVFGTSIFRTAILHQHHISNIILQHIHDWVIGYVNVILSSIFIFYFPYIWANPHTLPKDNYFLLSRD